MMAIGNVMVSPLAPPTAEELELQNQVTKALESQGVLNKIKAQLRAAVFQSIHGPASSSSLSSRPSQSVLPSSAQLSQFGTEGQIALALVRNLLENLELEHTLAVFLAEANLDRPGNEASEWSSASKLCGRVGVAMADEKTPVLVKMLRKPHHTMMQPQEDEKVPYNSAKPSSLGSKHDAMRESIAPRMDLPPPPAVKTTIEAKDVGKALEDSMADEVASGSFEESLQDESTSNREEVPRRELTVETAPNHRRDQLEDEDESPTIASPPPVPTKLGTLPQLPGIARSQKDVDMQRQSAGDTGEEEDRESQAEGEDEDEDLDDDAAAARLRALEEKLQEMEEEDDTGVLQQLKDATVRDNAAGKIHEKQHDHDADGDEGDEGQDDDDNYGDDFEEEIVEEDEEVASEMSEDLASISALSESDVVAPPRPKGTENDKAVDSEDALNSYDYIEPVEKD